MNKPDAVRKETIYRGMDGREVERIHVSGEKSRIKKPCGFPSREAWVYEHVLPSFPPIYPRLIDKRVVPPAAGSEDDSEGCEGGNWLLFEDLGEIRHEYSEELSVEVVRLAAWWHTLHIETSPELQYGLKPSYKDLASDLLSCRNEMIALSQKWGINPALVQAVYDIIAAQPVRNELVFCHGDLHTGNYAAVGGKVYVLDWEYAHFNVRHWDLYHVIDLSHPLYPRTGVPDWRARLLDEYLRESERLGRPLDREAFIREYHVFATAFSLWMLRLIESDLSRSAGPWTQEQLYAQMEETKAVFLQTAAALRTGC